MKREEWLTELDQNRNGIMIPYMKQLLEMTWDAATRAERERWNKATCRVRSEYQALSANPNETQAWISDTCKMVLDALETIIKEEK